MQRLYNSSFVLIDVSTAISVVTLEPLFQESPELAVDSREEDAGFVKFFGRLAKKLSL
ncbi:MAG: hypothetical protein RIM23_06045 [Coleofasciculus sp. G3-WIS-01]|uniref:hypothetical protein n=1 Tax=Coleofasciculus sp. G3-WIS-01 TaxID=3069528 RepID=UPI0033022AB6